MSEDQACGDSASALAAVPFHAQAACFRSLSNGLRQQPPFFLIAFLSATPAIKTYSGVGQVSIS
jgi:hypothetical protein